MSFFSGAFKPYQVVQKSHDLVTSFNREGIPVVAPWEYRTFDLDRGMVLGTNIVWLLRSEDVSMDEAVRLDLRVIMTGGEREVAVEGSDDVAVGKKYRQPGEVRVVVRRLNGETPLMELTLGFEEDPMSADVTTWDERPELRAALRETGRLVAKRLRGHYPKPSQKRLEGVETAFNPKPMFAYAVRNDRPLMESFVGLDAMDAMARKLQYYQYFDPDISMDRLMAFEAMSAGLWVEEPGVLATHGLEKGDYITHVGEHEAMGRQALWRPLLLERSRTVRLTVRRGNERRQVMIPLQNIDEGSALSPR